jgi:hypothetical protein
MSTFNEFNNFGFLSEHLTDDQLRPIKEEINFIMSNFDNSIKANDKLAGNIIFHKE